MERELFENCTKIELWFDHGSIFGEGYFIKKENIKFLSISGIKEISSEVRYSKNKFEVIKKFDCSFMRILISKDVNVEYGGSDSNFKGMTNFESIEEGKDLVAIHFLDHKGFFAEVYIPFEEGEEEGKNIYQKTVIGKDGDLTITICKR